MQANKFCLPPKKLDLSVKYQPLPTARADVLSPSVATTVFQTSASTGIIAASDEEEKGQFRLFVLYWKGQIPEE